MVFLTPFAHAQRLPQGKKKSLEEKKYYAPDKLSKVIAVKRPCVPKNPSKIWAGITVNINFSAKGHHFSQVDS